MFGKMIVVRQIREEDAPAFREVLDAVCRERRYLARLEAPSIDRVHAFVSSNVKAGYPQLVAEDDGKIVGWCDALPGDASSGATHVGRLGMGVLREYRRRNIGRRLIEATIEKAMLLGLEKIELSVHASNEPAIALYRSVGFEEEGRKKRGWLVDGAYDDILLMALELKRPLQPTRTCSPRG
jgi:L-amino acid N-acyltransferase YncA